MTNPNDALPAFSGLRGRCPKCSGTEPTYRWQSAGTIFHSPNPGGGAVIELGSGPEWMLRECRDCDYTWPEAGPTARGANTSGRVLAADAAGRPDGTYAVGDRVDQPPSPPIGSVVEFWAANMHSRDDGDEPRPGWGSRMVCGRHGWWYPEGRENNELAGRTWSDLLTLYPGPARIVRLPDRASRQH